MRRFWKSVENAAIGEFNYLENLTEKFAFIVARSSFKKTFTKALLDKFKDLPQMDGLWRARVSNPPQGSFVMTSFLNDKILHIYY